MQDFLMFYSDAFQFAVLRMQSGSQAHCYWPISGHSLHKARVLRTGSPIKVLAHARHPYVTLLRNFTTRRKYGVDRLCNFNTISEDKKGGGTPTENNFQTRHFLACFGIF